MVSSLPKNFLPTNSSNEACSLSVKVAPNNSFLCTANMLFNGSGGAIGYTVKRHGLTLSVEALDNNTKFKVLSQPRVIATENKPNISGSTLNVIFSTAFFR